ncbi:hypothetical protein TNCV_1668891 [Trichonephila clavipes]|nr:hypothetical protein TNCV_1668891 [Trichonephila clavipes]
MGTLILAFGDWVCVTVEPAQLKASILRCSPWYLRSIVRFFSMYLLIFYLIVYTDLNKDPPVFEREAPAKRAPTISPSFTKEETHTSSEILEISNKPNGNEDSKALLNPKEQGVEFQAVKKHCEELNNFNI